jgi:hypothetical protein
MGLREVGAMNDIGSKDPSTLAQYIRMINVHNFQHRTTPEEVNG